ncbi:DUF6912 family protein [Tomitella gaofuii]|uniref:DUF6912 family protein n=1 Tax=Tomitella gaofuii TaxID=2760083 RepID=UPI0015FD9F7F|nr:hypothetical protein [Tomitella gaofuii]
MRVFVPMTVPMLEQLSQDRLFMPLSGTVFTVTPALREEYTADGDDELAEVAMAEAARASLRLLSAQPGARMRRVVVSADVAAAEHRPDLDAAVARVQEPITLKQVASVHVDLEDAEDDVRRAAEVVDAADLGDEDAEFALGDAEDHSLAWYATQELPFLLELM